MMSKTVGAKMTATDIRRIRKLVKQGVSLNTSDFVRQAIREKIERCEVNPNEWKNQDWCNNLPVNPTEA